MSCYYHPEENSVVNCYKCGVNLCRDCEQKALYRNYQGTGQAYCVRCSYEEMKSSVSYLKSWLQKRLLKIVASGSFVLIGIFFYLSGGDLLSLFVCWFIATAITKIGAKDDRSVESKVSDEIYKHNHPIGSLIISLIVNTIIAPIAVLSYVVGYFRTRSSYKKELEALTQIEASM